MSLRLCLRGKLSERRQDYAKGEREEVTQSSREKSKTKMDRNRGREMPSGYKSKGNVSVVSPWVRNSTGWGDNEEKRVERIMIFRRAESRIPRVLQTSRKEDRKMKPGRNSRFLA